MLFRSSIEAGFKKVTVIPGEGVKGYYRKFGFVDGEKYMVLDFNRITNRWRHDRKYSRIVQNKIIKKIINFVDRVIY